MFAVLAFVLFADEARADFLVLKNGTTYRGTLRTYEDGDAATSETKYRYGPESIARSSKEETVDEVIANWSGEIGECTTESSRESCLSLAKFCVLQEKYKDATTYFTLWGKQRKWKVFSSKYYFILGNTKLKRMKEIALRLDAIMGFYQKEFGAERAPKRDFVVRFFKTQGQFDQFARKVGLTQAGAFYSPRLRELVLYDMSLTNKNYTFQAVFHEANHQYVGDYFLDHQPKHVWFSEGLATYYETAKYKSKRIVDHGRKSADYLADLRKGCRAHRVAPLKEFLSMGYAAFHCGGDQEYLHYAQAWGLLYFFKTTKKRDCRLFFERYIKVLRETKDDEKALAEALEVVEFDELEEAVAKFHKGL